MNLPTKDRVATLLVAAATLTYAMWLIGPLGGLTPGSVAVVVLVLGFLASASAVVPGFAALLAGSRAYLAIASVLGVVALASGILTVANATAETLAILVAATLVLWASATVRHVVQRGRDVAVGRRVGHTSA
jgi:hypothetical protein